MQVGRCAGWCAQGRAVAQGGQLGRKAGQVVVIGAGVCVWVCWGWHGCGSSVRGAGWCGGVGQCRVSGKFRRMASRRSAGSSPLAS